MKKLSIFISLLFAMNTMVSQTAKEGQAMIDTQVKGKEVPSTVLNKFKTDYPNEQPTWSQENGVYRATFVDGSKMFGHAVGYDKSGTVLYRDERLKTDGYPSAVNDYFTNKYPNDKYEVWATSDKAGKKRYYSNHNLETLWFDENGTYTSTSKLRN